MEFFINARVQKIAKWWDLSFLFKFDIENLKIFCCYHKYWLIGEWSKVGLNLSSFSKVFNSFFFLLKNQRTRNGRVNIWNLTILKTELFLVQKFVKFWFFFLFWQYTKERISEWLLNITGFNYRSQCVSFFSLFQNLTNLQPQHHFFLHFLKLIHECIII